MTEKQSEENIAFANAVDRLNADFGGHWTTVLIRQIDGEIFALLTRGINATTDGYDPTILLTNGEASYMRELRAKVTCPADGKRLDFREEIEPSVLMLPPGVSGEDAMRVLRSTFNSTIIQ